MDIRLDYTNMMASAVGETRGIRNEELEALRPRAEEIHRHLMKQREGGFLPFYDLSLNRKQLDRSFRCLQSSATASKTWWSWASAAPLSGPWRCSGRFAPFITIS